MALWTCIASRAELCAAGPYRPARMLLQRLPRRLGGSGLAQAPPAVASLQTCIRCRARNALIHTSHAAHWRTRQERQEALHGRDADARKSRVRSGIREYDGRRPHDRPPYPRSSTQAYPPREYERRPRDERSSANPYKKQVRPDRRDSLGVFSKLSSGSDYSDNSPRREAQYSQGMNNEDRLKVESRNKIDTAYNLAKELPPLTDADYKQVYEELVTYDAAPPSPSEQRLAIEQGSSTSTPLLGKASDSARDRMRELLERLNRRVPEGELPLTPVKGKEEEESLVSKLTKMRQSTSSSSSQGESGTLSRMLESDTSEETQPTPSSPGSLSEAPGPSSNYPPVTRPHARSRGKIFNALSQLLRPTPGSRPPETQLIIGEQPPNTVKLDIATKQEWAALVLEAADDRSLTDVLTTFELMKRAGVALSEDLLAAAIRLISKDQKLVPILLQYFEQNNIAIPLTAHHEVVVGILQNTPHHLPTTKAERYLRTLETYNRPALAKTYAAVIKHIFQLRRQTGVRAKAWNLFGHMRLVAHPTPSVEVFDAMIYGCSLDDRISPERALDLFTEMIELCIQPSYNTYLGLIRTCAKDKDKDSPFYFEALRLLKELLDRGFKPEKDIFNSILEGARMRGDLLRAKWIVANMLQLASRSSNPRKNPITPDSRIVQNLFLTAATYRPPNISKNAMNLKEVSDNGNVQDIIKDDNKVNETLDSELANQEEPTGNQSESAAPESTDTAQDTTTTKAKATEASKSREILYMAGQGDTAHDASPVQHPLYRPDIPQTTHQLLDDFTQVLGTIIEAHGLPTGPLELQSSSRRQAASETSANTDIVLRSDDGSIRYAEGLDAGALEALRNVPVNSVLFNAYLTLLVAHGRTNLALAFFKNGFPAYNVRPSHQTWETLFETLDSSSRQKDKTVRNQIRSEKASKAKELFNEWEEWLKETLRRTQETPVWFARHIETVYARAMGVQARAHSLDEGLTILEEFYHRFPPEKIREAAKLREINAGPSYLIQLSSFLYPETMDMSFNRLKTSETAYDLTGGKIIRKPLPKSQINSYNLWGLPPILSYQMVYSLFHRLREEEDDRAAQVMEMLKEYRRALTDALKTREEMEREQKSAKMAREARRGIIEQPGHGISSSRLPHTSQTLLESEQPGLSNDAPAEVLSKPIEAV